MGEKSIPEKNKDMDPDGRGHADEAPGADASSTSNPDPVKQKITGLEPGGGVPPGGNAPGRRLDEPGPGARRVTAPSRDPAAVRVPWRGWRPGHAVRALRGRFPEGSEPMSAGGGHGVARARQFGTKDQREPWNSTIGCSFK